MLHATKLNMLLLIVFTFIMSLIMVAINKAMDYFICKNYSLHHMKVTREIFKNLLSAKVYAREKNLNLSSAKVCTFKVKYPLTSLTLMFTNFKISKICKYPIKYVCSSVSNFRMRLHGKQKE